MSRRLLLCAALSLGIACSPAQSRPAPSGEPLPAALTDWLREARNECEGGGGTFRDGDYWQSGDLNGDHRPDFLVTRAALGCEGNDIFSGGTAGDVYEILVSGKSGYAFAAEGILAHDAQSRGTETRPSY